MELNVRVDRLNNDGFKPAELCQEELGGTKIVWEGTAPSSVLCS